VTALAKVSVMVLPEIETELTDRETPATETPNALAATPELESDSSKFKVICVGADVFTFPDRYEGARVSDVVTVKICEAIAVPVGEKTITRPVVAPEGMFTVIVVEVLVKVVVDFAPN
jgi:hypothetical protein